MFRRFAALSLGLPDIVCKGYGGAFSRRFFCGRTVSIAVWVLVIVGQRVWGLASSSHDFLNFSHSSIPISPTTDRWEIGVDSFETADVNSFCGIRVDA